MRLIPERAPLGVGTQLTYIPALDGIRAIAILAVMANHGGLPWSTGGLLGVNAFFVLSGFLITQLLLKEWTQSEAIRLLAFWGRRARRLLPALFLLLLGIGIYAVFFAPNGTRPSLLGDGLSTLFYVNNWHQIAGGQSYFVRVSALSPLLHTWTLAIEEQFYLIWPIVVFGVLRLWRSTRGLLLVAVTGALVSAAEMAYLYHPGLDPSRIYFGTDTRAQDVLVGAALGIMLFGRTPLVKRSSRTALGALVAVAGVVFIAVWAQTNGTGAFSYHGGFLLADLMVAVVISGAVLAPRDLPARALSFGPLRFIGLISYGLYLWHWPIFLVVNHNRTGLTGGGLFAIRFVATVVVAGLSWYLVEIPIRQMKFRTWRSWTLIPAGVLVVTGVLIATTGMSDAGPTQNSTAVQRQAYFVTSFPKAGASKRVLFVGDSLALYVGYGLAPYASRYGITIGGRSMSGCGLATVVPYNMHGTTTYPLAPCAQWPTLWQSDVDQLHPDLVVVVVGWWEAMGRMYEGTWQHLGQPTFDAYEQGQVERAVSVLTSNGARVALMTAPYFHTGEQLDGRSWPEDQPSRVRVLNGIIQAVADRHRSSVTVVPLNRYLDPRGHFTWTIDGQVMRLGDGVHTTPAAGAYLAPKILPQLAAFARARG